VLDSPASSSCGVSCASLHLPTLRDFPQPRARPASRIPTREVHLLFPDVNQCRSTASGSPLSHSIPHCMRRRIRAKNGRARAEPTCKRTRPSRMAWELRLEACCSMTGERSMQAITPFVALATRSCINAPGPKSKALSCRPALGSVLDAWRRSPLNRPQRAQCRLLRLGHAPNPRDIESLVGPVAP
jgi:hypothetical protein